MKVIVDITPAVLMRAGMGRYAGQLARALAQLSPELELGLFYADPQGRAPDPPLDRLPRTILRSAAKPWRSRVLLASFSGRSLEHVVGQGDVFHATDHLLPPSRRMRQVFTVHDLAFLSHPDTHLALNRWFLRLMMPRFVRAADAVICVSRATKDDVRHYYRVPEAKLHVIPEGVEPHFLPSDEDALRDFRARYRLPERFILSVGTIEPRKNLTGLLRAYERLVAAGNCRHSLVVVGRRGWKAAEFLSALAASPVRDRVVLTGSLPERDLPLCYGAADLFVYPSLYEGFGLPPLEALACGTPAVVSNAGALPETVGDAAIMIDPFDVEALATAMARALADGALRARHRALGLLRAKSFDWAITARQTLEVYRQVVADCLRFS